MLDALLDALPAYAQDVKRTLAVCLEDEILNPTQKWGCLVAAAQALAVPELTRAIETESPLSAQVHDAAKAVAAVMGMNNIYFRSTHLMKNGEYAAMRAGIRMSALQSSMAEKADLDLWAVTVSAINACGACLDDHEASARKAGASAAQVQAALKLAGAIGALAAVLRAEAAR